MSDFPIILLIIFALFIQIEASSFEAKMSEEIGQCSENMAVIFQDSTDLLAKYKALKRKQQ